MKRTLKMIIVLMIIFMTLTGCDIPVNRQLTSAENGLTDINARTYDVGFHDGYFYMVWTNDEGIINYHNGPDGNYNVQWNNYGASGFNYICGKGWENGAADRTFSYDGYFDPDSNGFLALYGWTDNPVNEYYVVESYGDWRPPAEPYEDGGTFISNGNTYHLYRHQKIDSPWVKDATTGTFWQYWSIREPMQPTGQNISGTINFADHVNAWENSGWDLGDFDYFQILMTEGYNSSGSADITIEENKSKYLGNILGAREQDSRPPYIYIPDTDGDHNFNYYWNQLTMENDSKWGYLEESRDSFDSVKTDNLDRVFSDINNIDNIQFKWHCLIWGSDDYTNSPTPPEPDWMSGLSPAEQREEVLEWFTWVNTNFPDIEYIDVVNEPLHEQLAFEGALKFQPEDGVVYTGPGQYEWVVWCFWHARRIFPSSTKLLINEYNIIDGGEMYEYKSLIEEIMEYDYLGEPIIDGIGLQCHSFDISNADEGLINYVLSDLGSLGLNIHISELDIDIQDEMAQRAELARVFPVLWEHQAVAGVTFWGYIWGKTWAPMAGLRYDSGSEREALKWLRSYISSNIEFNTIYDQNGSDVTGLPTPDYAKYRPGDTVIVPDDIGSLAKSGYKFASWNSLADGSGTVYFPGDTFVMGLFGIKLYAQWEPETTGPSLVRLRNEWTGGYLTLSNETEYGDRLLKCQTFDGGWDTQEWEMIEVGDGSFRFRSLNNNQYLSIRSQDNDCAVIVQPLDPSWASQQWYVEDTGGGFCRLRTAWTSDKALNCSEESGYAPIRNHTVDWNWGSMKWAVEPVN